MQAQTPDVLVAVMTSLALLTSACSTDSHGPGPAGYTKIDDMEGPDTGATWASSGGASPLVWWTATDCTEVGRLAPPPYMLAAGGWSYAELPVPAETFPGVLSTHAARMRTLSPLVGVYGANLGLNLADATNGVATYDGGIPTAGKPCRDGTSADFPATTVDLRPYRGLTFWARAGAPGAALIQVRVQDRSTDPRGGLCNAATPGNEADCYNDFRSVVLLTDTFTRYTVEFASMVQDPTYGFHPVPDVLDLEHVYSLAFQVDAPVCGADHDFMCAGGDSSLSFDLWVDDVYLVAK